MTTKPAGASPVDQPVRALPPKRADAPEELPTPGTCNVPPLDVWPVPDSGTNGLEPGPWMPGEWRPARDGKYLRYWPGSDDLAFSFWRGGLWHAGPFFDSKSDDQDLAWRGGVKKRPNVGGEARLAAPRPSQTTTATPQGVASTDQLGGRFRSEKD